MEDKEIGGMYLAMVRQWFSTLYHKVWRKGLMRSGMVTGLMLAILALGLGFAYREHMLGHFHRLKAKIQTDRQNVPDPRPGGQEPLTLIRSRLIGDSMPEFLSATMLPGRGMNVLQITAYLPGRGEVELLSSPTLEEAAIALNGNGADANGQASLAMGGAFEAPWGGRIWATPGDAMGHATAVWRGHSISLPADGASVAGGLMLNQASESAGTEALPDGGNAQAVYHAEDFGGHWPSSTELTVTVLLSSKVLELTVVAQNTGDVAEPIGIGWHPRFTILDGNRQQVRLLIPAEMRVGMHDGDKAQPTGALLPVAGTPYDFRMSGGAKLNMMNLDECFVALHQGLLDSGPVAELNDPANNYGLRLTALSPAIKAMRVVSRPGDDFVSIQPQSNYDDPFGREWGNTDTGMVVLQPGQSTQWKVRLELYSLANSRSPL